MLSDFSKPQRKRSGPINPVQAPATTANTVTDMGIAPVSDMKLEVVNNYDNLKSQYTDFVDRHRANHSILWRFIVQRDVPFMKSHLNDLIGHLERNYGENSVPPTKLPRDMISTFRRAVEIEDYTLMDLLFFFQLYLDRSIYSWFVTGIPTQGVPPPPLPNVEWFAYFVETMLPNMCEDLLSGKGGMTIDKFVEQARTDAMVYCGIPISNTMERVEFAKKNQTQVTYTRNLFQEEASDMSKRTYSSDQNPKKQKQSPVQQESSKPAKPTKKQKKTETPPSSQSDDSEGNYEYVEKTYGDLGQNDEYII